LIKDFIHFQYGNITPKNKMYRPVVDLLKKFHVDYDFEQMKSVSPIDGPSDAPHDRPKVKVMDKEKVMVEVKDMVMEEVTYGKSENYFHGQVPADLLAYAHKLGRSALDSEKWQRKVAAEIEQLGYDVLVDQVACPYVNDKGKLIDGWIDLRAVKGNDVVCIECDNRVTTRDSLAKILAYGEMVADYNYSGMIILRDPKPQDEAEYQLDRPLPKVPVKPMVVSSTLDRAMIEAEIFGNERWITDLQMTHRGKDIEQAWNECWIHHHENPAANTGVWWWKQKT
jgi:hypothetical protein